MAKPLGLNTTIVNVLREYGEIPVGFLAELLARRADEIESNLNHLQEVGAVARDGDKVRLAKKKGAGGE